MMGRCGFVEGKRPSDLPHGTPRERTSWQQLIGCAQMRQPNSVSGRRHGLPAAMTACQKSIPRHASRIIRRISPSYSRRSSIWCLRGFWDLGAHGFVRLFHRLTTDTFANALEG